MSEQKAVGWQQLLANAGQRQRDILFLRAKNLPVEIVCGDQVYEYRSVYDPLLRCSRFASGHEESRRVKHEYAFHVLVMDEEEGPTVKVAVAGAQLVSRLQVVLNSTSEVEPGCLPYIRLRSTGSGMNTEYFAEFTGSTVPGSIWDEYADQVAKLPLEKVVAEAYDLGEEEAVAVEAGYDRKHLN